MISPWWATIALDWECYKRVCDEPQVFSRWMLEQTRELVDATLGARIDPVCLGAACDKPADHRGGAATDMFRLSLDVATVRAIHQAVTDAVARNLRTTGTEGRGLGGFEEAWAEYLRSLEPANARSIEPWATDVP